MDAGSSGTFAVAWTFTVSDGVAAGSPDDLVLGSLWSWNGPVQRLSAGAPAHPDPQLAGRVARRLDHILPGKLRQRSQPADLPADETAWGLRRGFVVSDGVRSYPVSLLGDGITEPWLAVFPAELPPRATELWVADTSGLALCEPAPPRPGLVCFTAGTRLRTLSGESPVEQLSPGDQLLTRDNGPQEILWIGSTSVSAARLRLDPSLCPIQVSARALGEGQPDSPLLVSPRHRLLLRGRAARILFNAPEVLAQAGDLINDLTIRPLRPRTRLTYYHVLLAQHQVIWANGLGCESFYPADMDLTALAPDQNRRLEEQIPGLTRLPALYGGTARRTLSQAEAALYQHDRNGLLCA